MISLLELYISIEMNLTRYTGFSDTGTALAGR
jgi:hypothetical protein